MPQIRISEGARERLQALAGLMGVQGPGAVCETISYADMSMILQCTACRAAAEVVESQKRKEGANAA